MLILRLVRANPGDTCRVRGAHRVKKLLQGVNSRKALGVFSPRIVNSVHWAALLCRENPGMYAGENLRQKPAGCRKNSSV